MNKAQTLFNIVDSISKRTTTFFSVVWRLETSNVATSI